MFMLDTNIVIRIFRGPPPVLAERLLRHREQICISVITAFELHVGAQKRRLAGSQREMERVQEFLRAIQVLPFDDFAAYQAAIVRAELEHAGSGIGAADTLIAGHAVATESILVTNNMREFSRVERLSDFLQDWTA